MLIDALIGKCFNFRYVKKYITMTKLEKKVTKTQIHEINFEVKNPNIKPNPKSYLVLSFFHQYSSTLAIFNLQHFRQM